MFGDVVDDIVVRPHGEIRPDTDTAATIEQRPGGSAANTAAWLAGAGVSVGFVGRCGAGDVARHEGALREAGVDPHLVGDPELPTGAIVVVVEEGRRTMLTQRGANAQLSPCAVTTAMVRDAAFVHATGYSVVGHEDAFTALVERVHDAGARVSLNVGSVGTILDAGLEAFEIAVAGVDVVVANLAEGRLLTALDEPGEVVDVLAGRFTVVALTLGEEGAIVATAGESARIAPRPAVPVDPTGAGDAFAAGFVSALAAGEGLVTAGRRGTALAARAVEQLGGRPPRPTP